MTFEEVPIWACHRDITTIKVQPLCSSAVLATKHMDDAALRAQDNRRRLEQHIQAVMGWSDVIIRNNALLIQTLREFAVSVVGLRMKQIYPDFDSTKECAETGAFFGTMGALAEEALKPGDQCKFGYIVADLFEFDK